MCINKHTFAQEIIGFSELEIDSGGKYKKILSDLNGNLKLNLFDHFHGVEQDKDRYRFEFDLKMDFKGNVLDSTTYTISPRLRFDNVSWASGIIDEIREADEDRFVLNIDEGYLTHSSDKYDISVGKIKYEWGTADGYNPTDNINPYDFTDVPTSEKIGVPSISFNYFHEMANLEFVFVPVFTPSRLPGLDNRWIGSLSEVRKNFNQANFIRGRKELPVSNLDNSQFAIRLSSSTLVDGWDLSLSYYDGIDPIGVLRGELDTSVVLAGLLQGKTVLPNVTLFRVFPHYREIGADFSTTFGKFEVHGEIAAHITDGSKMNDDYVEYVTGINYNFDEISFEFIEEIMLVLEFASEEILDEKTQGNEFSGSGEYIRPFNNAVLTKINFKFTEDTKLEISSAINLDDKDWYVRPIVSHKFFDNTKIEMGFDIITGHSDTFFGKWRDNDRFFITFTQYF
ncbi:MAG: hypothetical protein GY781_17100 [Gammaproteobacteria bacterium]|nr:hypothetical protein [Gammaproteobacteria bacterium]